MSLTGCAAYQHHKVFLWGSNCQSFVQFDIHSPANTVYEALRYSAEMRLIDIDKKQLAQFVDQVTVSLLTMICQHD